jgi:predicted ATP-grasp superfamily ATP-dependent carboligase/CelD/BcsL family acetyltransferase involved in cellulose biosynthesis
MNKYKIPAIVLGMTVNGLGAARSLARNGVKVYALDSHKDRPAMFTRYAKCLVCPEVQRNEANFRDFLLNLTHKIGGTAVLLPTSDAHNEFVNNNREALEPYLKFAMSPKPIMDQMLNKKGQYLLAKEIGIPIPETYFPQSEEEVKALAQKISYPVILKGLSTGNWRRKFGDKKAVIVKNSQELLDSYIAIHNYDHIEPIIQEIIQGDDTCNYKICAYIDSQGRPLLTFTLQKIRQYPCDFGIGSSVISVWEPKVAELGMKFMLKSGYRGIGSIEFKKDIRENEFKMIEINPRLWAQNSLPDACGQNFALTAYLDIVGEKLEPKTEFKEGIKWIALEEDRTSFKGYHTQGRMSWRQWLKSILTGKRIWATWDWDDPLPFLIATRFGLLPFIKIYAKIKAKMSTHHDQANKKINSNTISLEIIKDSSSFLNLKQTWNALLEQSEIENPYLTYEWLSSWWKAYEKGKTLNIVVFKDNEKIIGLIPLVIAREKFYHLPLKTMKFFADHWGRMDFILTSQKQECLRLFIDWFYSSHSADVMFLSRLPWENENARIFHQLIENKGVRFEKYTLKNSFVRINQTWEEYLATRSKNFAEELKYKQRKIAKKGNVSYERFSVLEDAPAIISSMSEISNQSWKHQDKIGMADTKEGQEFYKQIIQEWGKSGNLNFTTLKIDTKPVAFALRINYKHRYYALETSFNQNYYDYSPGLLVQGFLLQELHKENNVKEYELGETDSHKSRWTDDYKEEVKFILYHKNTYSSLLFYLRKFALGRKGQTS